MRKKTVTTALLLLAGPGASVYAIDDLWARYRGKPVVEVTIYRDFTPRNRWNRSEYAIASPEEETSQTCVQAAFPHFGYPPCWYLLRQATHRTEIP